MPTSDRAAVDSVGERSVSFLPGPSGARDALFAESHVPVPVGPGRSATAVAPLSREQAGDVSGYPIQQSKVQCPPLREETLARGRLLDWLAAKIHHRVVFVVAEAGYGKTTLLADFTRRTRLRTLWYRLDSQDRDWVAFLSHLVAAGREREPSFGEATNGLLRQMGPAGPTREAVTQAFVRDVLALGTGGAVFVFDDYHMVDDSPEIAAIVGELLARAPERVSFVFSSRRQPSVRVARLRALGEVAELSTDDLRFSEPETEQLFRETYGHPLERDVLGDLSSRTEGWAASLQLVQAAIRDRTAVEIRTFVRSLTGAEGDLYDYLAEEVVGYLPEDLQAFLMKVSVLDAVDPQLAAPAAEVDAAAAADYLASAERIGVLGRRGRGSDGARGFHPLVRDFLRARFEREAGPASVIATHLRIARASEESDWNLACFHYGAAGKPGEVHRVLRGAMRTILGSAQFRLAADYLDTYAAPDFDAEFEAVRARAEFASGRRDDGVARAERALKMRPDSSVALATLVSLRLAFGDLARADELLANAERSNDPIASAIAKATTAVMRLSIDGNLSRFVADVINLAEEQERLGLRHYQGISLLNASAARQVQGEAEETLSLATQALDLLLPNSRDDEVASARLHRIWALAHLGRWNEAEAEIHVALHSPDPLTRAELLTEIGLVHLWYGDETEALALLDSARVSIPQRPDILDSWRAAEMELAIRQGDISRAKTIGSELRRGELNLEPAFTVHCLAMDAYLAIQEGVPDASHKVDSVVDLAHRQDAFFWARYVNLLAAGQARGDFSSRVRYAIGEQPVFLSVLAEVVAPRLADADESLLSAISAEAHLRPQRWRSPLRRVIDNAGSPGRWRAGHLLDAIGDLDDVPRLRRLARIAKGRAQDRALGNALARQLAPRIYVEDEGRVSVRVGAETVQSTEIRRKVLALLCFLVSRHGFSATRDQVIDALWPDLEPTVALNSLNQTVYFLRRVFEPNYQDDVSPGYLQHDSNVLWLDRELVSARSATSWEWIRRASATWESNAIASLAEAYVGRFALDFTYEEWAIPFRDSLHAAYLQVIETSIARDTSSGLYDRAISLARRALEADPDAEQIELSLLRLYRLSGAHSAAAEQYAHYANAMRRELGVEPPPFEML
jgi:DNA-binding SARP family transcriptional activator